MTTMAQTPKLGLPATIIGVIVGIILTAIGVIYGFIQGLSVQLVILSAIAPLALLSGLGDLCWASSLTRAHR